jgi:hypothetical protein
VFSFICGIVFGVVTVGAAEGRTLQVIAGNPGKAVGLSVLVSLAYWFGINFIVHDDLPGYIGFSIGAAGVIWFLSIRERNQVKNDSEK